MDKILLELQGKIVDVGCSSSANFRGEVVEVSENVLKLRDENGAVFFLAIDKIASVCERADAHSRPGFIA